MTPTRRRLRAIVPPVVFFVLLLLGWELYVRARGLEDYVLPAPSQVWRALVDMAPDLGPDVRATVTEAVFGLVVGAVAGVALAVLIALWPFARRAVYPLLVVSQTIPAIVFAPILIVWLGFGLMPKIVVVALVAFFPVVVSTVDGLVNADDDLVDLVHSFGGGRWQRLRLVQAPVGAAVVLRRAEDRRDVRGDRCSHRGVDGRVRGARTRDDARLARVPHRPRVRGGRRRRARQPRPVLDRPARGAPGDTVAAASASTRRETR